MKEQVMSLILSMIIVMGSVGGAPVWAAEIETAMEEPMPVFAEDIEENEKRTEDPEEIEYAGTDLTIEDYEAVSEDVVEEGTDEHEEAEGDSTQEESLEPSDVTGDAELVTEEADAADDMDEDARNTEAGQGIEAADIGETLNTEDEEPITEALEEDIRETEDASNGSLIDSVNSSDGEEIVDSGTCGDNLVWTLYSNGLLKIDGTGKMENYEHSRPYFGQVTGTTAPWNKYRDRVYEIIVSDGVTSIGAYAFPVMESLRKAELPDSVTEIGEYSFYRTDLTSLILPKNLKTIGAYSLSYIHSLLELKIPEGTNSIGEGAFWMGSFRVMWLPASLIEVADYAFRYASDLTTVYYAGTEEEWNAIQFGEDKEYLTDGPKIIFANNTIVSDREGTCGENVKWNLDEDGTLTIFGTGDMDDYVLEKTNEEGSIGVTGYNSGYTSSAPWANLNAEIYSIIVNSGVTHIGSAAFYNCYNVSSVSLPETLASVGEDAFRAMHITSIEFPDSVRELGKRALYACYWLEDVKLPAGVSIIPNDCFSYAYRLKTVVIPSGVTTIERSAFSLTGVIDLTVPDTVTKALDDMGLTSGYGRKRTIRFLGALPQGLSKSLLTIADVTCPVQHYEEYKDYLLPFMLSINAGSSNSVSLCSLSAGDIDADLEQSSYILNENKTSEQIVVTMNNDNIEETTSITWESSREDVIRVTQSGVAQASGTLGGSVVYAEVSKGNAKKLLFCRVNFEYEDMDGALLQTIPTEGILPNLPATGSTSITSASEGIVGYYPSLYIETDKNNELYKELLDLTNTLTEGCTSDTDKVIKILTWVRSNVTWSDTSLCIGESPEQVYAVYLNKIGNCQGFSKLTGFLFSLAQIPNAIISNDGHMWNAALLDGSWTMLDAQLGSSALNADYSSDFYSGINNIFFSQGDLIFAVDTPGSVKLAGVGANSMSEGREEITNIEVPDFVTEILGYACRDCKNLQTVLIQEGTKSIRTEAFAHCSSLAYVTIPVSVTQISDNAFDGCDALTIRGYAGSYAETFAANKSIPFIPLCTKTGEEHDYSDWAVAVEATCTEDGCKKKICSGCGDEITEVIPATGHDWNDWTVAREATENEEGLEIRNCRNDELHKEERSIPKLAHVHDLVETKAQAATCTENGNIRYWTCCKCGKLYSDSAGTTEISEEEAVIPAKGHIWDEEYTVEKKPTCTETGSESIHCTVCNEIREGSNREIAKTAHNYGEWKSLNEATCTEAGSKMKVCEDCGDEMTEIIPAKGHDWDEEYTIDKEATCKEEGSESIHCSVCGEIKEGSVLVIEKRVHIYGDWETVKEATCTEAGSRNKICTACGDDVSEEIPAKGHTWNEEYTVDKEPTSTEDGSKSIHCSICDAVKEGSKVSIPKLMILPGKTTRGDMFNLANNVKVTWKEVPGAKYYKIYREGITDPKESRTEPVIVTERLVGWDKQPGLTNGHAYRYKIVASMTGKGDSSGDSPRSYSKVMYRLKTVVIRSVKNTAPGKVTVKYDRTAAGDSYVLQYCERQDMVGAKTKVVLGANNTSYVIGGLKKGRTYYISIRVRKKVNGVDYYTTFGVPKKVIINK